VAVFSAAEAEEEEEEEEEAGGVVRKSNSTGSIIGATGQMRAMEMQETCYRFSYVDEGSDCDDVYGDSREPGGDASTQKLLPPGTPENHATSFTRATSSSLSSSSSSSSSSSATAATAVGTLSHGAKINEVERAGPSLIEVDYRGSLERGAQSLVSGADERGLLVLALNPTQGVPVHHQSDSIHYGHSSLAGGHSLSAIGCGHSTSASRGISDAIPPVSFELGASKLVKANGAIHKCSLNNQRPSMMTGYCPSGLQMGSIPEELSIQVLGASSARSDCCISTNNNDTDSSPHSQSQHLHHQAQQQLQQQQQPPGYRNFKPGVGYRLGKRKVVFEKRKRISDYALVFALFGITVMIVETEMTMASVYTKVCQCL